ncbi:MAG TPA: MerR family transcriptional regulator [Thermoanaerobaculia bacterium]|nr:MerR family transcriptional regulator [Thermoanaerobaculia bacterium]
MRTWKIGELAQRTGLTVRTLHHYDEIGLLSPSYRTGAGHRLYTEEDVQRLQMIVSLRQLDLPLREIGEWLAGSSGSDRTPHRMVEALDLHLGRLREQIENRQTLYRRLSAIAERLRSSEEVSAEDFLITMEMIAMYEKYYTPEQLQQLEQRRLALGEEGMRAAETEWPELIARVRAEKEKGTDPADETVQALARRWRELIEAFTGGDPGIAESLRKMYQQEPSVREQAGVDPEIFAYVSRAWEAGTKS